MTDQLFLKSSAPYPCSWISRSRNKFPDSRIKFLMFKHSRSMIEVLRCRIGVLSALLPFAFLPLHEGSFSEKGRTIQTDWVNAHQFPFLSMLLNLILIVYSCSEQSVSCISFSFFLIVIIGKQFPKYEITKIKL